MQEIERWNQHLLNHSTLYISVLNKIQACLKQVRCNQWIKQYEVRSECIEYAITSHRCEMVQPTLEMLSRNEIPYICCLTDQQATWNHKKQRSTCVRVQFLHPFFPSMWFTVDIGMVAFLHALSFLGHIEPFIEQEIKKVEESVSEFPPVFMLEFERYFLSVDLDQSIQYVYRMIDKHITPPSLEEVEQSFLSHPPPPPRHVPSQA